MELIILNDGLYQLIPVTKQMTEHMSLLGPVNCMELCEILRLKLTGYVNSTDNFMDQPKVLNGASEIIAAIFGDRGLHTRAAVSANSLPLGVAVEVDAIFEIK